MNFTNCTQEIPVLLYDINMATSAAPTFFKAYEMQGHKYVDGGNCANNPALDAYNWSNDEKKIGQN